MSPSPRTGNSARARCMASCARPQPTSRWSSQVSYVSFSGASERSADLPWTALGNQGFAGEGEVKSGANPCLLLDLSQLPQSIARLPPMSRAGRPFGSLKSGDAFSGRVTSPSARKTMITSGECLHGYRSVADRVFRVTRPQVRIHQSNHVRPIAGAELPDESPPDTRPLRSPVLQ